MEGLSTTKVGVALLSMTGVEGAAMAMTHVRVALMGRGTTTEVRVALGSLTGVRGEGLRCQDGGLGI